MLGFGGMVLNEFNLRIDDVFDRNFNVIYIKELVSQMIELNFSKEIQGELPLP